MSAITSHKLFDAACGIDQLLLARVERMAECADFDRDNRALDTVDDLGVVGLIGRDANPLMVAVNEYDRISLWVNSFFHFAAFLANIYSGI